MVVIRSLYVVGEPLCRKCKACEKCREGRDHDESECEYSEEIIGDGKGRTVMERENGTKAALRFM